MSFNPIDFLYFNPELQAYSNVITIEDAFAYYNTHNPGDLVYDTSVIPSNLEPIVFLSTNKDALPISWMSQTIRSAMSNEGLLQSEINTKAKYCTTIYTPVTYSADNEFSSLLYPDYQFDSNNITIGDEIKLVDDVKHEYVMTVTQLTPATITVAPNKFSLPPSSSYILDGIKVVDPLRMAKIFMARDFNITYSNQQSTLPDSGSFNAPLYKLLYPDATSLTDQAAFIDYVAKRKNNVYRVNNADEIVGNFYERNSIKIQGINIEVSSNEGYGSSNRLVTEYGVKRFTVDAIEAIKNVGEFANVIVTSNMVAQGPATFNSDLTANSNLKVSNSFILSGMGTFSNNILALGTANFASNVNINNALIYGSLRINGNMYNARIGIGYTGCNNVDPDNATPPEIHVVNDGSNTYITGSNIGFGTSNPTEKVEIQGNLKVSNDGFILGSLGIGLSNPQFQLQLSQDSAAKPSSATWTVASDSNLKTNIINADLDRCYGIVRGLPLRQYSWGQKFLSSYNISDKSKLGWIAQEVQSVFPKSVNTTFADTLGEHLTLDADQIYAAMYGCIQKLQNIVEELKEENQEIKAKLIKYNIL
jgi:hypothetical protein